MHSSLIIAGFQPSLFMQENQVCAILEFKISLKQIDYNLSKQKVVCNMFGMFQNGLII